MTNIPESESMSLIAVPDHACDPVQGVLGRILEDVGESLNPEASMRANQIADICGRICVDGCQRDKHNNLQEIGMMLPDSAERDLLFKLVEDEMGHSLLSMMFGSSDAIQQFIEMSSTARQADLRPCAQREGVIACSTETMDLLLDDLPETTDDTDEPEKAIMLGVAIMQAQGVTEATILELCSKSCTGDSCFFDTPGGKGMKEELENEREQVKADLEAEDEDTLFHVVELENWTGPQLKEVIMKRMDFVKSPELLENLKRHFKDSDGNELSVEEIQRHFEAISTPVADDETWDVFAEFIKGNLRFALSLFAYFQEIYPLFRSSDPKQQARAERITEGDEWRDGGWRKKFPGFRPANPFAITALDFNRVAEMIDPEGGYIHLWDGNFSSRTAYLTDSPEDYAEWRLEHGEIIEQLAGDPSLEPPTKQKAIEAASRVLED